MLSCRAATAGLLQLRRLHVACPDAVGIEQRSAQATQWTALGLFFYDECAGSRARGVRGPQPGSNPGCHQLTGRSSADFCCRVRHCRHADRPSTYRRASHHMRRCLRVLAQVVMIHFRRMIDECGFAAFAARRWQAHLAGGPPFHALMPRGWCPFVPVRFVGRGGPEHGLTLLPTKVRPPFLPCLPVRACVAGSCAHHRSRVLCRCFETATSAGAACADIIRRVQTDFVAFSSTYLPLRAP